MVYNNELYHYGVKGMKWGVRRTIYKSPISKFNGLRESREMLNSKSKKRNINNVSRLKVKKWIHNTSLMDMNMQAVNQMIMNQTTSSAINASLMSASLSASGGMNPFMFGQI